jgi:hypothetical protein
MQETAIAYTTTFLTALEDIFSKQLVIPRLWPPKSLDLKKPNYTATTRHNKLGKATFSARMVTTFENNLLIFQDTSVMC